MLSQPRSLIIIAGDLNAKVGSQQSLSMPVAAIIAQQSHPQVSGYTIKTQRSFIQGSEHAQGRKLAEADEHGHRLNDFCTATDMTNLTGLTDDDSPVVPSYWPKGMGRIDHILVSPTVLPYITGHSVHLGRKGSDHLPVLLTMNIPLTSPPPLSSPTPTNAKSAPSLSLMKIIPSSDPAIIQRYVSVSI